MNDFYAREAQAKEQRRQEAAALAESRGDWYVSLPGRAGLHGPLSEREMRRMVDEALAEGRKPVVLKSVEDYGS